jgi:Carboxypeptidase regulatory-like domain
MQNNTNSVSNSSCETFSKRTQRLLLMALCGMMLALPMSAQSFDAATPKPGSIQGTVVDTNDDPIPNATVILKAPIGDPLRLVTNDDGAFAFHEAQAGVAYQISVTAQGFADWSSSVTLDPGQEKTLTAVKLRILAVQRAVTVSYSEKQVATQQLKAEEHQRVLGFIPNIYVTYEAHPEPLTARMKFHLFYKGITQPAFFGFEGLWAGVEQYASTPNYPQGARGYGERFGANLASGTSEALFANAVLPSLLHQDPRYFYRGSGTKGSRAWHALLAPFICQGDNGKLQPNYSQVGGSLISAGLSYTYYPGSNRDAGLVFRNFGTNMGLHVALGLAQEFILGKVTSRGKH